MTRSCIAMRAGWMASTVNWVTPSHSLFVARQPRWRWRSSTLFVAFEICHSTLIHITMSPLSPEERAKMAHELRGTIRELRDRGLVVAAKWYVDLSLFTASRYGSLTHRASELLMSIPKEYRTTLHIPFSPPPQVQAFPPSSPAGPSNGPRPSIGDFLPAPGPVDSVLAGSSRSVTAHGVELEEEEDVLDEDIFQLAKSYYDMKEFDRVVFVLKGVNGKRAKFLRIYSAYLVRQSLLVSRHDAYRSRQIEKRRRACLIFWTRSRSDYSSTAHSQNCSTRLEKTTTRTCCTFAEFSTCVSTSGQKLSSALPRVLNYGRITGLAGVKWLNW